MSASAICSEDDDVSDRIIQFEFASMSEVAKRRNAAAAFKKRREKGDLLSLTVQFHLYE